MFVYQYLFHSWNIRLIYLSLAEKMKWKVQKIKSHISIYISTIILILIYQLFISSVCYDAVIIFEITKLTYIKMKKKSIIFWFY